MGSQKAGKTRRVLFDIKGFPHFSHFHTSHSTPASRAAVPPPPRLPPCQPFSANLMPIPAGGPGWRWQAVASPLARQRIAGADIDDRLLGPAFVVSSLVACALVRFGHPCRVVAVLQILKFECQPQPLPSQPLESVACFSSLSTPYHLSPSLSLPLLSHGPHFLCQSYRGLELTLELWYVPDVSLGTSISRPFSPKP